MTTQDSGLYSRVMQGTLGAQDDPSTIANMLVRQVAEWKCSARGVYMSGAGKAPDWLEFEFRTWELGEAIRQTLEKRRSWARDKQLIDAICSVVRDKELGRGREPFIELIGRLAAKENRDLLLGLLDETGIAGHAVKALRLGRIVGASEKVRALLSTETRQWVKREAERYLALWT